MGTASRPFGLWRACCAVAFAALAAAPAVAATVAISGLFGGKVLVSVDGGPPRSLAAGQRSPEGVLVVAVGGDSATVEFGGQRRVLRMGESFSSSATAAPQAAQAEGGASLALSPDSAGHYATVGAINDRAVRFVVDTGASLVWLSADLANRLGVDYRSGQRITVNTAGGPKPAYLVRLASVRVGSITLRDVEGAVGEGAGTGDLALLGMSFLSRLAMSREGTLLRLSLKEGARPAADARAQHVLKEKRSGLFATEAQVNGVTLPFLVDTGATLVALDAAMARRIGLNFEKGTPGLVQTANGQVRAWRVKLDQISAGQITLYNIDATVLEGPGVGVGLLGMSFLNRVEMKRDGETLVLIKRF